MHVHLFAAGKTSTRVLWTNSRIVTAVKPAVLKLLVGLFIKMKGK